MESVCMCCWMRNVVFKKPDASAEWLRDELTHQKALGRDYYAFWEALFKLMLEEQQR